jgi:iron complex outermembrane receptor protein
LRHLKIFCLIILGFVSPYLVYAQNDSSKVLETVLIKAVKFNHFQTGLFVQNLDSHSLLFRPSQSLDQVLAQTSGVFIKSYGPSQISSSSARGGNAQQTAVLWNGFNISNPMLGQQDLSLLPAFLFDAVSIQYGAQSGLYGSGNIGAGIHISGNQKANKGFHLGLLVGYGSFGDKNTAIKASWGSKKLSIKQKFFYKQAENNFDYISSSGTKESMKDAATNSISWLQDFTYRFNANHDLTLHTWYQKNDKQIPAGLGNSDLAANQNDESKRISGEYKFRKKQYSLAYRAAYFNDKLDYYDDGNGTSISTGEQLNQAIDQTYSGKTFNLLFSAQIQNLTGISKEYQQTQKRNVSALFGSFQKRFFTNKLELQYTGRQEWNNGNSIPFISSIGGDFTFTPFLSMNAQFSEVYRLPTLNDLYWVPGGNINLKPETGNNIEVGFTYKIFKQKGPELKLNAYQRKTENQITWLPISSSRWEVVNLGNVEVQGLELFWNYAFKIKNFGFLFKGQHDYCNALNKSNIQDPSYNKQLIYVPRIKHSLQMAVSYKTFYMYYVHQYIGQRFYTSTNTESLDDYMLGNISISKKINLKNHLFTFQYNRLNCFGTSYYVVVNRPMPGADNQLSIQYQF